MATAKRTNGWHASRAWAATKKPLGLTAFCWIAFTLLLMSAQGAAAEIAGKRPQVVDGDSFLLVGNLIDLDGLDAPELDQTCRRAGVLWACGQAARSALINRIAFHWVFCVPERQGSGGAIAATCYLGGIGGPELNAWLVAKGWALADRPHSLRYAKEETAARAAGLGLWSARFVAPWDWRKGVR